MKNFTLTLLSILVSTAFLWGQSKEVVLVIDHTVAGEPLEMGTSTYETSHGIYTLSRVSYYLCQFSLLQEDGAAISLGDKHLLVHGDLPEYNLGSVDVENVKGLQFSLGVDPDFNHQDPGQYDPDHPLAYQSPSMHWGWAAGYNFLVMEGMVDSNGDEIADDIYNYHCIGNEFLRAMTYSDIQTSVVETASEVRIFLRADYDRAFKNFQISGIIHGGGPIIESLINNFAQEPVIEGGAVVLSQQPAMELESFEVFPNPADDNTQVRYDFDTNQPVNCRVMDLLGRQQANWTHLPAQGMLSIPTHEWEANQYWILFEQDGQLIGRRQLSVVH